MRLALLTTSLLVIAAASPALAQTPVQRGETYVSAPWWMRAPVIASTGLVQVDLTANRAYVSAGFRSVDRSVAEASRAAADQVRAVSRTLGAYGEDKVRPIIRMRTTAPDSLRYDLKVVLVGSDGKRSESERGIVTAQGVANSYLDEFSASSMRMTVATSTEICVSARSGAER